MPDTPPSFSARFRASRARLGFFARLAWRISGRALALLSLGKAPTPAGADPLVIADYDQIVEALQTGDTGFLARLGRGFAASSDSFVGQPWLFNAIDLGSLAALQWFLAQRVALDGVDKDGRSVLQAAIERAALVDDYDDAPEDPLPMIVALLEAGAAINAVSRQGLTPLHVAAALGLANVVRVLLALGADASLRDDGFAHATPLDYAVQAGHQAVADLLRD
ncbi:ankyrin repeat domain-containing protein [Cypionkella sp.]|uniref:ankyrin repeat domain-containing protein n=1 Tax=Cypionkella sp. TaxID=2811411 RepID=UPI002ABBEFA2|nr:ankyrin repeat domain-containing protein [Cypionkella sp.]MDZ4396004.1 ankyrin repeat domain-containing protein [Cypionkella sp.]